jgi:ligand-binding sensor domain-containing protein/two-component sensor histidine kinase
MNWIVDQAGYGRGPKTSWQDRGAAAPARRTLVLARSVVLLLVCPAAAFSLDPNISIPQYLHTSWTQEEGSSLPAIQSLAQTRDGYLWLGTGHGLIRFDGLRFVPWEAKPGEALPGRDIRFLQPSSEGGLWISTAMGIARLDQGHLIRYPALDRWLGGTPATSMMVDHEGNLWIAGGVPTGNDLRVIRRKGSIQVYGPADGLPDHKVVKLFEDSLGNLWIGTQNGLCRWSPGNRADCLAVGPLNVFSITEDAGGELIIGDRMSRRLLQLAGRELRPILGQLGDASLDPRLVMRDRDGNIWIGTAGQGLLRLHGSRRDRFTRKEGLSSDFINGLLEDREGNLWVSTARGIDQFREPKVLHVSTLDGLSSDVINSVCISAGGDAWIGTTGGGLNHIEGRRISHYLTDSGLPSSTVLSVHEDRGGRLWAGTSGGLVYRSQNRFVEVDAPDGGHLNVVFAITEDQTGDIIAADARKGLFSIRHGRAEKLSIAGLEKKDVYQLLTARNGVLWIGYYQGGISAVRGNSAQFYGVDDGLPGGPVQAIYEDRDGTLWVGTRDGLSRFRGGQWASWMAQQGLPEGGVNGIVEDDSKGLWLMTGSGILRLERTGPNGFREGSPGHLAFPLYGRTEGLRLPSVANMANPRIAKAQDGRLWVATEDGAAVIDPRRIRSNPVPPPVAIEQLLVDGRPMETGPASGIKLRGSELQIVYTGLSLTVPESVRFRYRLDGLDRNWTDAGTRRNVTYVNLPPRKYLFRVTASNNDGVWNTTGVSLAFQIAPYFYQTRWFAVLCAGIAALLAWGIHWLQVRRVVTRFRLIAQERTRVTRELHDSLLQGFSGVVLQLEAAARQFESNPGVSKQRLERAIDQADHSLTEARRTIMSMRLPALENHSLPEALSAVGSQATEGTSISFHLAVRGHVRQLPYDAQANLYLVGREAITNAVNHARAKRIAAHLTYSTKETRLTVEDDGSGFDLESAMAKKDHWGVLGMQERAKHLGTFLSIDSAAGRGTKIEVAVPGRK